jgi:hypothetical protein
MLHPLHSIQNCNIISMYTVVESADADGDGFGSDGDVRECSIEGDEALDDGGEEGTRFEMEAAGAWGNELRRKDKRGNKKKGKKKGEKHSLGHRSDRMRQQVLGRLLQHSASVAPQLHACNFTSPPFPLPQALHRYIALTDSRTSLSHNRRNTVRPSVVATPQVPCPLF